MTTERLEQYRKLKIEIPMLKEEYQELLNRKTDMTSDSVTGSMLEYPYIKRVVKIQGLDVVDMERAERMRNRIRGRQEAAEREVEEIDAWIGGIQDSQMRQIVTLRFVRGMSWVQVAHSIAGGNGEDGIRKAFSRFMKKSKNLSDLSVSTMIK